MAEYLIQDTTLAAIGDAIRNKTGNTELIMPENMPTEIENIQSGTKETPTEKDFNFYDYDGTLLYSYSREEVLQLTELPPLPIHPGLICQGWNWTLEQIKGEANENWYADVGAIYITDDGKTRIYITTPENDFMGYMNFQLNGNAKLNWGDGSGEIDITNSDTNTLSFSHNYVNSGDYIITIEVTSGTLTLNGNNTTGSWLMLNLNKTSTNNANNYVEHSTVKKFEGGENCIYEMGCFAYLNNLETVTIPQKNDIKQYSFMFCDNLKAFIFPLSDTPSKTDLNGVFIKNFSLSLVSLNYDANNFLKYDYGSFENCYNLKRIILPRLLKGNLLLFKSCYKLSKVILPLNITSLGNNSFTSCYFLDNVDIPNSVTTIGNQAFYFCYSIYKVYIPNSVTSIDNSAFSMCYRAVEYDFTDFSLVTAEDSTKSLPITFGTNVFHGLNSNCRILFKDTETAEVAKATTNLAQYADYIHYVGETEVTS